MKKKLRLSIALCILTAVVFGVLLGINKIEYGERISIVNSNDYYMNITTRPVQIDKEYEQSFQYNGDDLYSFEIKYSITDPQTDAHWKVQLFEKKTNSLLQEWNESSLQLEGSIIREYVLDCEKKSFSEGEYIVKVTSDYVGEPVVYVIGSENDTLLSGKLYINREIQEGDLSITYSEIVDVKITLLYGLISSGMIAFGIIWLWLLRGYIKIVQFGKKVVGLLKNNGKKICSRAICVISILLLGVLWELVGTRSCFLVELSDGSFHVFRYIFWVAIGLCIMVLFCERKCIKDRPEVAFCLIALIIGVTYVFVTPSEAEISWDESIHFWKSVGLSHATTGLANAAESRIYWKSGIPFGFPNTISYLKGLYSVVENVYNSEIGTAANTDVLSRLIAVAYLPSATFLKLSRGLGLPFWIVFKMGAVGNVLVYVANIYFAMRKLKSGKMIMAAVATIGTAFFLSTVYSTDSWIVGFTFLGIAYFLSVMQKDEKVKNSELAVMVVALTVAYFPKAVYFPILVILLLLPRKKFQTNRQYRYFLASVLSSIMLLIAGVVISHFGCIIVWPICFLMFDRIGLLFEKIGKRKRNILINVGFACGLTAGIFLVVLVFPKVLGTGDIRGGEGVNSVQQVIGIIENPIKYIKTLFYFLKDNYLSFSISWKNLFTTLGYLGSTQCHVWGLALVIIVCLTDKTECDKWKYHNVVRIAAILLSLICICLIASALYISFTPVGATTIYGCQQRYLLPLFYPVLSVLGPAYFSKFYKRINRTYYNMSVIILTSIVLLYNIWTLVIGLYT